MFCVLWKLTIFRENNCIVGRFHFVATIIEWIVKWRAVLQFHRAWFLHRTKYKADLAGFAAIFIEFAACFVVRTVAVESVFSRQYTSFTTVDAQSCGTANFRRIQASAYHFGVNRRWLEVSTVLLFGSMFFASRTTLCHDFVEFSV